MNHVCLCVVCARKKNPQRRTKAPLLPIPVGESFERIAVDIVGPLKRTCIGNKYIVCFTDYLTKWAEAFPIKRQTADVIASILVNKIIFRFGSPRTYLVIEAPNFLVEWSVKLADFLR